MRHWPLGPPGIRGPPGPRPRIRVTVTKRIQPPPGTALSLSLWSKGCTGTPNLHPHRIPDRWGSGVSTLLLPQVRGWGLVSPRVNANLSGVFVSSVLGINLTSAEDYGAFTCFVQNVSSSSFTLWRAGEGCTGMPDRREAWGSGEPRGCRVQWLRRQLCPQAQQATWRECWPHCWSCWSCFWPPCCT